VTDEIRDWSRLLAEAVAERDAQPRRICGMCVDMLDVSGAGISLITRAGHRGVVCSTDDRAAKIEDLQVTIGVGPCIDAVNSGAPVLLPDLDASPGVGSDRWPEFFGVIAEVGVRAVFAFPLRIGGIVLGALDLYRDRPGDLSPAHVAAALLAADAAALALLQLHAQREDTFSDDPQTGATYRFEIHQATGMVKEQLGVSLEDALLMLRARAFSTGRSVADVAADVVARRTRFTMEDT